MSAPNKNQRFTEEGLKIIQEFYKRAPPLLASPQPNYYQPQPTPAAWPFPAVSAPRRAAAAPSSPDSLKNYITRAFSKCTSDVERDFMEKLIKEVIAEKKNSGLFFSQDWDRTDLPILPREQVVISQAPSNLSILRPSSETPHSNDQIQKRKSRFEPVELEQDSRPHTSNNYNNRKKHSKERQLDVLASDWKIVGTCQELEKHFFRLTSKPDPDTIRPEPVLKKALAWLKDKWRKGEIKYEYFSGQLRSIRQDLTVQGIHNKFSVEIYQVHARLALEAQDLDQFNSCMSRLFELYKEGIPGRIPVRAI